MSAPKRRHARSLVSGAARSLRRSRGQSDRVKRKLTVASTMSTSETELIESTYMVTPTSTGGPAIKPNHNELIDSTYMVTPTSTGGPEMLHGLHLAALSNLQPLHNLTLRPNQQLIYRLERRNLDRIKDLIGLKPRLHAITARLRDIFLLF